MENSGIQQVDVKRRRVVPPQTRVVDFEKGIEVPFGGTGRGQRIPPRANVVTVTPENSEGNKK